MVARPLDPGGPVPDVTEPLPLTPILSVVVPALNEAERLPALFDTLDRQTLCPDEVIVADAGSTDDTRAVAEARGARVVDGGLPAVGRNAGAAAATGDLIVFLDADVELADDWFEKALLEFQERELAIATSTVDPLERDAETVFACDVTNLYLELIQYVAPHAPGFCIIIRRDLHERIGGFDETVALGEDHDYVQRAFVLGKFRVLKTVSVATSMRRIEKEGLVRLAFKYLYCELYAVRGEPIRRVPFAYEFGDFTPKEREAALVDVTALRERLGEIADELASLSAEGVDALRALGSRDVAPELFDRLLHELPARDLDELRRYLLVRRRLARLKGRQLAAKGKAVGLAATAAVRRELIRLVPRD
jgi:glycosyltransferase involved in cell wall biosynthesis